MKRTLLAAALAFVCASVALVALVLPAEFGVDPTGVGGALGLTGLAGEPGSDLRRTETPLAAGQRTFELAPFESVEFKLDLAAGDGLVYAWTASSEMVWDLHAEPEGAAPGVAESFGQGRSDADRGTYLARFDGIHGWFWENRAPTPTTVRLQFFGFATGATLYEGGLESRVPVDGV